MSRLSKLLGQIVVKEQNARRRAGLLGKPVSGGTYEFQTDDNDRPGFVIVREGKGDKQAFTVGLNMGVPLVGDLPVDIVYSESSGHEMIFPRGVETAQFLGAGAAFTGFTTPHSHEIGTGNTDLVSGGRFRPGLIHATDPASLSIAVEAFTYRYGGAFKVQAATTYDMTGDLPATSGAWNWVLILFDPATATISGLNGSDYFTFESLTEALLEGFTVTGNVVLGAVRLYQADTAISDDNRFARDPDPRQFISGGEVLSAGSLNDLSDVVITSAAQGDILRRDATDWDNANIAEQRIVGRITGGDVTGLTAAQVKTLLVIDHGADLTGLTDDDHTQYVLLTPTTDTRNVIQPSTSTVKALTLKGAASQSDNLLELQDSAAAVLSVFDESGWLHIGGSNPSTPLHVVGRSFLVAASNLQVLQMRAFAGHTAPIAQWETTAGTRLGFIDANGRIDVGETGASTNYAARFKGPAGAYFEGTAASTIFDARASHATFNNSILLLRSARAPSNAFKALDIRANDFTTVLVQIFGDGGAVFNENGEATADFRVEGDTDVNVLFVDASADTVQVGAATASDSAKLYVAGKISTSGEVEINGALNHDGANVGFFGTAPATQQTELTDELTTITHSAPGTPDYAIQDLVAGGFGFVTLDEALTVLSAIANLQTRSKELEDKLVAYGLLIDAD